jgi:hypothetical protein
MATAPQACCIGDGCVSEGRLDQVVDHEVPGADQLAQLVELLAAAAASWWTAREAASRSTSGTTVDLSSIGELP